MRVKFLLIFGFLTVFFDGVVPKGFRLGKVGKIGSSSLRGGSAARASVRSGSFSSARGSLNTYRFRGRSYYTPDSSSLSRNTFYKSLATSAFLATGTYLLFRHTSRSFDVNGIDYYFDRGLLLRDVGRGRSMLGKDRLKGEICVVPVKVYSQNRVPLDTSVNSNAVFKAASLEFKMIEDPETNVTDGDLQNSTDTVRNGVKINAMNGPDPVEIAWHCENDYICCYMECCPEADDEGTRAVPEWIENIFIFVGVIGGIILARLALRYLCGAACFCCSYGLGLCWYSIFPPKIPDQEGCGDAEFAEKDSGDTECPEKEPIQVDSGGARLSEKSPARVKFAES